MFSHLLLPTDGSDTSERAIRKALELARLTGARVTGIHVIQPSDALASKDMQEEPRPTYDAEMQVLARRYLEVIVRGANDLRVPVTTRVVTAEHVHDAIVDAARWGGCDLIVMASHGRRGLKAFVLGSETQKVLTHTEIPVLVVH